MRTSLFLSVLLTVLPSAALAWNGEGHQIVALIAEDHLTPHARAEISDLLDGGAISDAEVASWADQVKRERQKTAPLHYVNIPVTADSFDPVRDGRDGQNVIEAIESQVRMLSNPHASRVERQEALKFVVHFVGDIHQPLHCADRDGDRGGNARLVFWRDKRAAVSLHAVWDTWILRGRVGRRKIADVADSLASSITPKQRNEWATGTPEQWANQSHQLAVEIAYGGVPVEGPPPKLGAEYFDKAAPVVTEQLQRGGVRLAMVLNSVLK